MAVKCEKNKYLQYNIINRYHEQLRLWQFYCVCYMKNNTAQILFIICFEINWNVKNKMDITKNQILYLPRKYKYLDISFSYYYYFIFFIFFYYCTCNNYFFYILASRFDRLWKNSKTGLISHFHYCMSASLTHTK